jgi:hypothetical protein
MRRKLTREPGRAFALFATTAIVVAGCGGDEKFENEPRPPAPVQLTGVIRDDKLTVSPNRVGAGPVILLISNQTDDPHTITLDGSGITETVGPVNPLDTAKLQQTLDEGSYEVKAGSERAVAKEISPAVLEIGPERKSSKNQVLLP